ncbi:MAG: hypothetical protein ACO20H_06415 [Bacteriovoracaceae bacterium]
MKTFFLFLISLNTLFAQDNLIKKEELFRLKAFETTAAFFTPNISYKGFHYEKINFKKDIICQQVKRYDLFFALFYSARFLIDNNWEQVFKKCQDYLLVKEKKAISGLFKEKKKSRNATLLTFHELVKTFKEKPVKKFKIRKEILQKIKTMPNGLLRSLAEGFLALKLSNKAWAHKEISKIINTNFTKVIFEIDLNSEKEAKLLLEDITFLVNEIIKYKENKDIGNLLLHYMALLSDGENFKNKINEKDVNWSLQEMRVLAKDYTYGIKNLGFWFYMIGKRAFKQEALTYFTDFFNESFFKYKLSRYAWLLQYGRPLDPEFRAKFYRSVVADHMNSGIYSQYLLIRLLEIEEIKSELVKKDPYYKKPPFSLKRNFFRKLVKSGKYLDFAIYELYLLGDRDSKVFQSY